MTRSFIPLQYEDSRKALEEAENKDLLNYEVWKQDQQFKQNKQQYNNLEYPPSTQQEDDVPKRPLLSDDQWLKIAKEKVRVKDVIYSEA